MADVQKRPREDRGDGDGSERKKRRSRFADEAPPVQQPDPAALALAAAVHARAAAGGAFGGRASPIANGGANEDVAAKAAHLKALQASIQATLANTNVALGQAQLAVGKKARDFSLKLDDKGRQIDAEGNVVRAGPVVTLKANQPQKKPVNPYLAHKKAEDADKPQQVDPRLRVKSRDTRGKNAFRFTQEGKYTKIADAMRFREQRKIMAGYTSGRKRPEQLDFGETAVKKEEGEGEDGAPAATKGARKDLPPARETLEDVPEMEWWDQAYLDKATRAGLQGGGLPAEEKTTEALYDKANIDNAKTHVYVQHPPAVTAVGNRDDKPPEALPVYLTKRERKRIRRTTRLEREREKQDKIALGLMQAPEPKMKLSNFMKILGDQAVADPSKVEAMVMKQVQQRRMNHEMRNQARKLTPEERREKKRKKLLEDTSKEVQVAVFHVADMSDPKKRFKVDRNAQQLYLTGGVLTCSESEGLNLVVVEGGPRSIKKYVKLMTRRLKWGKEDFEADSDDSDSEEESEKPATSGPLCELVWRGTVVQRAFNAFKFQECKSTDTARKVMEQKGVAHYWDMVVKNAQAQKMGLSSLGAP